MGAAILSGMLMLADHRFDWMQNVRRGLSLPVEITHFIAHVPSSLSGWVSERARSTSSLRDDNDRLNRQLLILQQKTQRLAVLEAENVRLRELLNSSARLTGEVRVAEIIGVEPDPNRQELVLNQGTDSDVRPGQAVLDAHGLMGQVVEAGNISSRVLLITDATHAISVQVNRNGVRSILAGTGHPDRLALLYVPDTADIVEGDLLVSTGLGGRFPAGYPVAEVTRIQRDPSRAFLTVEARPVARVDRATHVLLVQTAQPVARNPESATSDGSEQEAGQ